MTDQRLVPGVVGFAPLTDAVYLREIQRAAARGEGLVNSLRTLYATLDTDAFFDLDAGGRTDEAVALARVATDSLAAGGADFVVVTSNTGSIILESNPIGMPEMLDIFGVTIDEVASRDLRRPGLLATERTLRSQRYQECGIAAGIDVIEPPEEFVVAISELIEREASRGIQSEGGLRLLRSAVRWFAENGADCVILGCTDLVLFGAGQIGEGVLPIVDSTVTHARAAAARAMGRTGC